MNIYKWILLSGFAVFLISAISIFYKVLISKRRKEYSKLKGNIPAAISYSFTGAMSPMKKESAYLHKPTYIAGIIFHMGSLFCFINLILLFFNIGNYNLSGLLSLIFLAISVMCGISMLIKRIIVINLKDISNPEDYFSNVLVILFQVLTICAMIRYSLIPGLLVYSALLMVYIPFGKLKHSIYFITSRIYLGMFYGRRQVWGEKQKL